MLLMHSVIFLLLFVNISDGSLYGGSPITSSTSSSSQQTLKPVKVAYDKGSIRQNLEVFGDSSEDEGTHHPPLIRLAILSEPKLAIARSPSQKSAAVAASRTR